MDSLTKTGTVLGTAAYLSPEQARGERTTAASDRYALAVVAWELLTGERPFTGDTPAAEATAHVHGEIPALSTSRPDLPRELDDVFHRALAKDPAARYPTAADFVASLEDALWTSAGQTVPVPTAAPPRRRPRPGWLVPGIVALALLGTGLLLAALIAANDDGGGEATGTTVVRTVTAEGSTQEVTVTAEADPPGTVAPPPTPAGLSVSQARALQDESTAAMNAGDWERALALAQQALPALEGRDPTYEGYANYNIGRSLAELGRCDEAMPYLDRREELGGPHPDVESARALCA